MNHDKIFIRENGKKVKIEVRLSTNTFTGVYDWRVAVEYCLPRKRTWISSYSRDDYSWRNAKSRANYEMIKHLEHCTSEEIVEVKKELISRIQP